MTAEGAPPYRKPRLGSASTAELVEALRRPDAWWRETAARLLYQRQDKSAVGPLERLVAGAKRPATRAAALWALEGLGALRPEVAEAALEGCLVGRPRAGGPPGARRDASRALTIRTRACGWSWHIGWERPTTRGRPTSWLAWPKVRTCGYERRSSAHRGRAAELLRRLADDEIAPLLAVTIGARNDEAEIAAALGLARGSPTILRGLGDGLNRANRSLASVPALAPVFEEAERAALDESKPVARRVEAVRMLSYGTFAAAKRCLPRLFDARRPRRSGSPPSVRWSRSPIGKWDRSCWNPGRRSTPRPGGSRWRGSGPADRQALLLEAMEKDRVSPAEIGADLRRALLGNKALAERAEKLVGSAGAGDRRAVVQAYRPALGKKGNATAGREVFRKNCVSCHRIGDEGHEVGPNLASIRTKSPEEILDQILDPNRLVEPQYFAYQILTTGGRVFDGILDAANETSVTLRRAEGATETVLRANIEKIVCSGVSLMPEGLEKVIDLEQMADLIAFLRSP